jgi:hypothetical protein
MKFNLLSYLSRSYPHLIAAKIIKEKLVNSEDELYKLMEGSDYAYLGDAVKSPIRNAYRDFMNGCFDVENEPDIELTFKEKKKIRKRKLDS